MNTEYGINKFQDEMQKFMANFVIYWESSELPSELESFDEFYEQFIAYIENLPE